MSLFIAALGILTSLIFSIQSSLIHTCIKCQKISFFPRCDKCFPRKILDFIVKNGGNMGKFWKNLVISLYGEKLYWRLQEWYRLLWQLPTVAAGCRALTGCRYDTPAERRSGWSAGCDAGNRPGMKFAFLKTLWLFFSRFYLVTWSCLTSGSFVPSRNKRLTPRLKWFSIIFMENKASQIWGQKVHFW